VWNLFLLQVQLRSAQSMAGHLAPRSFLTSSASLFKNDSVTSSSRAKPFTSALDGGRFAASARSPVRERSDRSAIVNRRLNWINHDHILFSVQRVHALRSRARLLVLRSPYALPVSDQATTGCLCRDCLTNGDYSCQATSRKAVRRKPCRVGAERGWLPALNL
jgi:hypothetical protein